MPFRQVDVRSLCVPILQERNREKEEEKKIARGADVKKKIYKYN
jgi:hypothetical protein